MAKRRRMNGKPLLLASGVVMAVGCGPSKSMVTGNLMAPPTVEGEVCVDTLPEHVETTITIGDGAATERCTMVYGEMVNVVVTADGMVPVSETHQVLPKLELTITMRPAVIELVPPDDIGPPVGNLMPPPDMPIKPPETAPQDEK